MNRFIQLHILTAYPPANLNRDDNGRPKTAKMGCADRLRISSQCIKRAWRTSDSFQEAMNSHLGERTKLLGVEIFKHLLKGGVSFNKAVEGAKKIAGVFGKNEAPADLKKKKEEEKNQLQARLQKKWQGWDNAGLGIADRSLEDLNKLAAVEIAQLAFISPKERTAAFQTADQLIAGEDIGSSLDLLRDTTSAVDVALFGRMLADSPANNIEAACQVSHPISVHPVTVEDDYFTAVDDLNDGRTDAGAAHLGETGFAAGLFYTYICINRELLQENLNGDHDLAGRAIAALTEAAMKESPSGKQNSFASRARASYVLVEKGDDQPRSLSVAFLKPVPQHAEDYGLEAVKALEAQRELFNRVYEESQEAYTIDVARGKGTLSELLAFVGK